MSGSCREKLPDGREWWEAITNIREWSGGHPKCPKVVSWPSRMSRNGREVHPDVREWSGDPTGCPEAPTDDR